MKKILLALAFIGIITLPLPVSAAGVDLFDDVCNSANVGGGAANSAACKDKDLDRKNPIYGPDGIITKIVNIITIIVGIAAVLSIILAGVRLITSGSNPEEVTKAREYIQYAVIGLIVAALAQAMVRLVLFRVG